MYLVSANKRLSSVRVGVATAVEALKQMREFEAQGYTAILDFSGREQAVEDVKARALDEESRAP